MCTHLSTWIYECMRVYGIHLSLSLSLSLVYTYIYIYIYIHTYKHTHSHTHTHTSTHAHTCTYICTGVETSSDFMPMAEARGLSSASDTGHLCFRYDQCVHHISLHLAWICLHVNMFSSSSLYIVYMHTQHVYLSIYLSKCIYTHTERERLT